MYEFKIKIDLENDFVYTIEKDDEHKKQYVAEHDFLKGVSNLVDHVVARERWKELF